MNIEQYKIQAFEAGYWEQPLYNSGLEVPLNKFVEYELADRYLKIYLNELILRRSFYGTYMAWYQDIEWFLIGFFENYSLDIVKPELSNTIKEAANMIIHGDVFTGKIIGTTFMFGIIEFYAKYKLGYRPYQYDFFDKKKGEYMHALQQKGRSENVTISNAIRYLQQQHLPISKSLNSIEVHRILKLKAAGIQEGRWLKYSVGKRLSLARNAMVHGELHQFSDMGYYLLLLYTLFHLHEESLEKI